MANLERRGRNTSIASAIYVIALDSKFHDGQMVYLKTHNGSRTGVRRTWVPDLQNARRFGSLDTATKEASGFRNVNPRIEMHETLISPISFRIFTPSGEDILMDTANLSIGRGIYVIAYDSKIYDGQKFYLKIADGRTGVPDLQKAHRFGTLAAATEEASKFRYGNPRIEVHETLISPISSRIFTPSGEDISVE